MDELLKQARWKDDVNTNFSDSVFDPPDSRIARELVALWHKYRGELEELSNIFSKKYQQMTKIGFSATFGDVEGELLYILIRELKPELVYEISPNSGCSTNYILAAVTRNGGVGRVRGFEIESSFNGMATLEAIASNQIELCDFGRYDLEIGDARKTVLDRLRRESPDFCLIDSWHEDVFAEFYVHNLFPRVKGTVLVQDVAHFDPRPEWSTEAAYLLNYLQMSGTKLVPIAAYEDFLNASGTREHLEPRRPKRSNSILLHFEQACQMVSDAPHERYQAAWSGHVHQDRPAICDILAIWYGRAMVSTKLSETLAAHFIGFDQCSQVLVIALLARNGYGQVARELLRKIDTTSLKGSELPLYLAQAASVLRMDDMLDSLVEKIHSACQDLTIATGYRQLLALSHLQYQSGRGRQAQSTFDAVIETLKRGSFNLDKVGVELAAFCLRHPTHFSRLNEIGLEKKRTIRAAGVAGRALLRSTASRVRKRFRV
jgi:predicted O-methyltransferase YrrM